MEWTSLHMKNKSNFVCGELSELTITIPSVILYIEFNRTNIASAYCYICRYLPLWENWI